LAVLPAFVDRFERENDLRTLSQAASFECEEEARTPDGAVTHWLVSKFCFQDAAGKKFVGGVGVDISKRKQAEEALRASEERNRSLVSIIADVPWTADAQGSFVARQPAWEKYTGQSEEEYHGFGWMNAVHPQDQLLVEETWKRACRDRIIFEAQGRLWHAATRQHRYFQARAVPLPDGSGGVREWVGTFLDIHEKKLAVDALREAQRRLIQYAAELETKVGKNRLETAS
jgi:PAS domain S-box-containing protein